MKKCRSIQAITLFALFLFLLFPLTSSLTELTPNQILEDQVLLNREAPYDMYSPKTYNVSLNAGHWTVMIEPKSGSSLLEVNITIASDINMTNIIAVSGTGYGNFPEVNFTIVSDNTTVYILVHENSLNGDTAGIFSIGVYDDAHFHSWAVIPPTPLFPILLIISILVLAILLRAILVRKTPKEPRPEPKIQVVQAPPKAIPEKYQRRTDEDDGLRMVRIPTECPKCGAPLSPEEIDWVGPLEAKCGYCGATVRAQFERI